MLTGLGLCTWLLQRQRPLFLTQGWIIFFFFWFSPEFFLLTGKRTARQLGFAASHFGIRYFFSQAKLRSEDGFKPIVHSGFMWLAASGDCGLEYTEYSCWACCKALSVCVWSYPAQARTRERALWAPRTITGFSNEQPNKNKRLELHTDPWHCSASSHKQTPAHFLQFPQTMCHLISEQSGQKTQKQHCIMPVPPLAIPPFKPLTFILMDDEAVTGPGAKAME